MTGYVFHCTPCGNAHAGECPPKAVAPTATGGLHFNKLDVHHFPYVSSVWRKYILLKGVSTWRPGIKWEVTALNYEDNTVWIRDADDRDDKSVKTPGEAWADLGGYMHPDGTRVRFEKIK